MARTPTRYALSTVAEIAESLRALPPAEPDTITRREAVERLKPVIVEMRKKGYSLEQVAELLKARGLETTASTLKADLRSCRPPQRERSRRAAASGLQTRTRQVVSQD